MADMTFNTTAGQTIKRELLIAYLNTGSATSPQWKPVGKRVEDSSLEYDWGDESKTDIFGDVYTTIKKPVITQSFDPYELDGGDVASVKVWNQAIKDQDISAMAANDMLIAHLYAGTANTAVFAERYNSCMVKPNNLGGAGGGTIGMGIDVTYGGTRTPGTASISSAGVVTFSAAS